MTAINGFELATQQRLSWRPMQGAQPISRCVIEVCGELDPDVVQRRLDDAVARHEILRTTFALPAGRRLPFQVIAEAGELGLQQTDLTGLAAGDQEAAISALGLSAEDLDPAAPPLVTIHLARCGEARHVMVLSAAATVLDARSLWLLAREILGGETEDEPLQYADYAAWQADLLADAEPVVADTEPSPGISLGGGGDDGLQLRSLPVSIDLAVVSSIAADSDPSDVWMALWIAVLARSTGQERISVAVSDHGRSLDEVQRALGVYARQLPVSVTVTPEQSARSLIEAVAAARAKAEELRDRIQAAPTTSIGFVSSASAESETIGGLKLRALRWNDGNPPREITLDVSGAWPELRYEASSTAEEHARRIVARLATLAAAASKRPDEQLAVLDILGAEELRWLEQEVAFGPQSDGRPSIVHHRFEEHAARTPEAPAVAAGDVELSYAELNSRANRIAHGLLERDAGRGSTVALLFDRSADLLASVLGTLKAGAAYLPLNPDQPVARLAFQLQDAGASIVLTEAAHAALAASLPGAAVSVDQLAFGSTENPAHVSEPGDVAYVIYTSGSTGTPKGVETTHGALANYVAAVSSRFGWDREALRFGLVTTLSTDLGNTSVFPALATGGTLEMVPVDVAMDGSAYATHVAAQPVDVLKITPSHLTALLASDDPRVLPRRRLVLGGEAAPWPLVARVRELGDCAIANHYGPTETTIGSLTWEVGDRGGAAAPSASVPIGRPLANTFVRVVDQHDRPVGAGAPGELLIGGAGLARGYRNKPEQTAERFVTDPVGGEGRVYRTGDLVRILTDGSIEFLRRVDDQLKIRGFRVEPGEVEAVLADHESVARVAVVAQADARGEARLVAYAVPVAGGTVVPEELKAHARTRVPDYMTPAAVVVLDSLPLLPNGKLDRSALPDPDSVQAAEREHVAPRNDVERRLAEIWMDSMSLDRVSVEDDFFELGGHSLLATQVIARIRNEFGVQLPLHSLFTAPRIAELALAVGAAQQPAQAEDDEELAALLEELEGLSDEDAERLLRSEEGHGAL